MKLVERRIGLLFALFLLLLGAATARAAWLGTVKSESLGDRAVQQQIEELVVPAPRGTIMDRHGVDLAVSEDAVTVFAHPFLIDDPAAVAARLAPLIGRTDEELLKKLSDRDSGFVYLRRRMDASLGQKIEELGIEGIDTVIEPKRSYPQGHLAAQVLGMVGDENTGLSGLEYSHEEQLGGDDGERRLREDAPRDPRARELAARGRQKRGRLARLREPEPGHPVQLRAGLDLQGVHGRRRARGGPDRAPHAVPGAADDPGRGPRDRRGPRRRGR